MNAGTSVRKMARIRTSSERLLNFASTHIICAQMPRTGNADRGADATCGDSGVRCAETPKMVRVFELMRAMTIRIARGEWPNPEIHRLTTNGPPELIAELPWRPN
ncbi:hypothetical protein ATN79_46700 [Paraburkholderia caribensis]|nr:hypothetical protein ATN79_46700 [Paraburkholderia caribensis]